MTPLLRRMADRACLLDAWTRVRRGGKAPGMDGVTLDGFGCRLETEIERLTNDIRSGAYRPWPARRVRIPKSDGGQRLIGVQAVRDRVAQRALLGFLQPRVEPTLEPCSFAYRPGRSIEAALSAMAGYHRQGFEWAARSDVRLCFDSLDRRRLFEALKPILPERDAARLVDLWLRAGVVDDEGLVESGVGVPQGDVLSPLLCNLYLDDFDEAVNRPEHPLVRYADDFVILGRSERDARRGLDLAANTLQELSLAINEAKSSVVPFIRGFEFLGAAIVGSLILPLHRVERPGRPPVYRAGYEAPRRCRDVRRARPEPVPAPARSNRELRDRMVALLRAERRGQVLPEMARALLHAWMDAGRLGSERPELRNEGWQSVYLI